MTITPQSNVNIANRNTHHVFDKLLSSEIKTENTNLHMYIHWARFILIGVQRYTFFCINKHKKTDRNRFFWCSNQLSNRVQENTY